MPPTAEHLGTLPRRPERCRAASDRMAVVAAAALSGACSCGPTLQAMKLADLSLRRITIDGFSDPVRLSGAVLSYDMRSACASVQGLRMSMDGTGWKAITLGEVRQGDLGWETRCVPPMWNSPGGTLPVEPVTLFEFADDSLTVRAGFRNLGAPRSLAFLTPASGQVKAGSVAELAWSPDTDAILGTIEFLPSGQRPAAWKLSTPSQIRVDRGRVTITVPTGATGSGTLDVWFSFQPGVELCENAEACATSLGPSHAVVPIVVEP